MIEIDGSCGGGAVVRISAALATLTSQELRITNIRVHRPQKGLSPQHLSAVEALSWLSQANVSGLNIGSEEISFIPRALRGGSRKIDIKTAGSMTLLLQALMIPAPFTKEKVELTLKGGSDVKWSPPYDYFKNVTVPVLEKMGYRSKINLIRRGHFPKGGGILKVRILPIKNLASLKLFKAEIDHIKGVSHAVNLPRHIAERQASAAEKILRKTGYQVDIKVEHGYNNLSPGSGIVVWAEGNTRIGGSSMGEKGLRAEKVGEKAAKELLYSLRKSAALDKYMGDQIIPYLALAGDSLVRVPILSSHARTNIALVKKITGKIFQVHETREGLVQIKIQEKIPLNL